MIAIVFSFPDMGRPLTHHCGVRQTGGPGLVALSALAGGDLLQYAHAPLEKAAS
jgi:hypothetical protein